MRILCALLAAAVAANLSAQTVYIVGLPGAFAEIQDAVLAASPGDVVLVFPGTYARISVTKALTIRAMVPGTASTQAGGWPSNVFAPANQSVHLIGLRIGGMLATGSATFDDCTFDQGATSLTVVGGSVQLQSCVLAPPPAGVWILLPTLQASGSDVTAVDCRIEGVDAAGFGIPAPAIALTSSTFRGSFLTVRGGNGAPTAPAIQADAASHLWLSDSTVNGDPASCPIAASHGRYDRCTVAPNCSGIPSGFVLGVHRLGPPVNGSPLLAEFRTQPNAAVGIVAALSLEKTVWPALEQALLLPIATACPLDVLFADSTGLAIGGWPIPSGPAVINSAIWLQAFSGPASPIQASPVIGGVVR